MAQLKSQPSLGCLHQPWMEKPRTSKKNQIAKLNHKMVAPDSSSNNIFLVCDGFPSFALYRSFMCNSQPQPVTFRSFGLQLPLLQPASKPELWIVQLFRSDFKLSLWTAQKHECRSSRVFPGMVKEMPIVN